MSLTPEEIQMLQVYRARQRREIGDTLAALFGVVFSFILGLMGIWIAMGGELP